MGHFRLNIMLLTFAKFVEFLKSGAVKVVYTVTVFQPKDMLKFCLYLTNLSLKYAYKHCAYLYTKECISLT